MPHMLQGILHGVFPVVGSMGRAPEFLCAQNNFQNGQDCRRMWMRPGMRILNLIIACVTRKIHAGQSNMR